MNISNTHRKLGPLWGALSGDALGVPVEFQSREAIRTNPVTDMRGFGTHGQPAGTWSDDSSLLLCTAESFAHCGEFDPADLAGRFVRWANAGHWAPHGSVFDIGIATSHAISRLGAGVPPEAAGGADVYDNGNGSLMRILPVALWFRESSAEALVEAAQRASSLTHRHPRSQMACALYCLVVRELLRGVSPPAAVETALTTFQRVYEQPPFVAERLHFQLLEARGLERLPESEISSSGYVMHTLTASLWCLLTSSSFEETVLKAVNLGDDTDTTGTVAGGLAGAYYGIESIPPAWIDVLARRDEVAKLFQDFLAAHAACSGTPAKRPRRFTDQSGPRNSS